MDLRTAKAYQDVTNHMLDNEWYAYYETKDKVKNREVKVCKTSLYTCMPLNSKQCRLCKLVVIEMAWWFRHWCNAGLTLRVLLMCQVLLMLEISPMP